MQKITTLVAHGYAPPEGFAAALPGIHKASTVLFANTAALRARDALQKNGYTYGLHGTPTTFTLEERIATLEGATHCVLVPSGLAAIALTDLALLAQGDEVLLPSNVYGPSRELARRELAGFGVAHRLYDAMNAAALGATIGPHTKLVWLEAPGSVTMEFPDLRALAAAAHAAGALVALDHTWGAGLAFDGFAAGADIVVSALTKYASGGADVLMGSVCTRDDALHERIKLAHMRLGMGVGANDAEAVLRGLPTIALRYDAADAAARRLAAWLGARPEVVRVLHPAFEASPGHAHWRALCDPAGEGGRAAGLFSVIFDPRFTPPAVDRFVDALRLFRIGYSWAGPLSLAVPYELASMRGGAAPWPGTLVRFSIGLEDPRDLLADLEQALAALA
jgi:cystathionine beta-lyase